MRVGICFTLMLWIFSLGAAFAEPVQYDLDGEHTQVIWSVNRFGFTNIFASFVDISGSMILDEAAPEQSSVTVEILVASVRSDLEEREDVIRSGFWLGAEEFPVISFASTGVELLPGDGVQQSAEVSGVLTLHGASLPITMHVVLNSIGVDPVSRRRAAGFSATGSLARSDFGIETAANFVGDSVSFQIEALAIQR